MLVSTARLHGDWLVPDGRAFTGHIVNRRIFYSKNSENLFKNAPAGYILATTAYRAL